MSNIPHHISRQFDDELETIRSDVLAMGGLAEQQFSDALQALIELNVSGAEKVMENEDSLNSLEVSIDEECVTLVGRRQPAASDLRFVIAVIKTITDLERIGDEADKIARMTISLAEKSGPRSHYVGINTLGAFVRDMVRDALNAFARMDIQEALVTARKEPESDEQYGAILRQLMTYMIEDPRNISSIIDAMWVARALERIADHARNICENVIYFVEGKDVRHISIEQMEDEVRGD